MLPTNLTRQEQKAVIKEAITEWLDGQFANFGKWTLVGLCSAGLVAMLYFTLLSQGWKHS